MLLYEIQTEDVKAFSTGHIGIAYMSPEYIKTYLSTLEALAKANKLGPPVVDEGHCIELWYDFLFFVIMSFIKSGGERSVQPISGSVCLPNLIFSDICICWSDPYLLLYIFSFVRSCQNIYAFVKLQQKQI